VINVRLVDKGVLVAFFDVEIPQWHITIYGCQHFKKEARQWVSLPSRKVDGKDGKTTYLPYIKFSDVVKKKFEEACLAELAKQSTMPTQQDLGF